MNTYEALVERLDEFIRKYYKNLLIKGALFSVGIWVTFFLIINVLEYFGNFSTTVRTILFYCFLGGSLWVFTQYILITLLKYFRLGKTLSYEQSAKIIGDYFPEVKDKLLNILQLNQNSTDCTGAEDLIEASINQKIKQLSPISFNKAVDFSKNKKYLRYTIIPVLGFTVIFFAFPSFIIEPSKRIIHHQTYFEKPAPFSFVVTNEKLQTLQQEDFNLKVKIKGEEMPAEVCINIGQNKYKLQKDNKLDFSYLFKNVQTSLDFYLEAGEVRSATYHLETLPKPVLVDFSVQLDYPKYLAKEKEVLMNIGDLIVPKGTVVTWNFVTKDTRTIGFLLGEQNEHLQIRDNGTASFRKTLLSGVDYTLFTENEYLVSKDTLRYSIAVVEDAFPSIQVIEQKDSTLIGRLFFRGTIKDDYGFSRLTFNLSRNNSDDTSRNISQNIDIPIDKSLNQQEFYYQAFLQEMGIKPGDQITYYFEVWDNDGINGPKPVRSQNFFIGIPTIRELDKEIDKTNEKIKDEAEKQILELKKIQKEIS